MSKDQELCLVCEQEAATVAGTTVHERFYGLCADCVNKGYELRKEGGRWLLINWETRIVKTAYQVWQKRFWKS